MPTAGSALSRLRQLATTGRPLPQPVETEVCDLCSSPVSETHRHMVDIERRRMICVCRPCSILFDRGEAGGAHYRLIPDRARRVIDFVLDEATWQSLQIPVDLAFFFHSTPEDRVVAFYPGPLGATESLLELSTWQRVSGDNPVLRDLEPDVEALLVDRTGDPASYWTVPIDECYRLVGLIRMHWKGLGGGPEVWARIAEFFAGLGDRSSETPRHSSPSQAERGEATWSSRAI